MQFHEILRNLIEEHDLTQKWLAQKLSIPVSTLGGYVQGTSEPDFQTLIQIADYFSVTTDYLLDRKDDHTQTDLETELLRVFRSLNPEQQALYVEQGKAILKFNQKEHAKLSPSITNEDSHAG